MILENNIISFEKNAAIDLEKVIAVGREHFWNKGYRFNVFLKDTENIVVYDEKKEGIRKVFIEAWIASKQPDVYYDTP